MEARFENHGIRFAYPADWELSVEEDGARTTISLERPDSSAFALITIDDQEREIGDLMDEALEAMRESYPDLECSPALEARPGGRTSSGYDLEFFCLDIVATATIRGFRLDGVSVLVLSQWTAIDPDDSDYLLERIRQSIERDDEGSRIERN